MSEYTAIIRADFRVSRESIYDLRLEIARLADLGLIKINGVSKEILVVRGGEFIGWLSVSYFRSDDDYDVRLEQPTSEREIVLWQLLVDMID